MLTLAIILSSVLFVLIGTVILGISNGYHKTVYGKSWYRKPLFFRDYWNEQTYSRKYPNIHPAPAIVFFWPLVGLCLLCKFIGKIIGKITHYLYNKIEEKIWSKSQNTLNKIGIKAAKKKIQAEKIKELRTTKRKQLEQEAAEYARKRSKDFHKTYGRGPVNIDYELEQVFKEEYMRDREEQIKQGIT